MGMATAVFTDEPLILTERELKEMLARAFERGVTPCGQVAELKPNPYREERNGQERT